jgi:hypothetical protein
MRLACRYCVYSVKSIDTSIEFSSLSKASILNSRVLRVETPDRFNHPLYCASSVTPTQSESAGSGGAPSCAKESCTGRSKARTTSVSNPTNSTPTAGMKETRNHPTSSCVECNEGLSTDLSRLVSSRSHPSTTPCHSYSQLNFTIFNKTDPWWRFVYRNISLINMASVWLFLSPLLP